MKLVILESPYAASATHTVTQHVEYARACVRDSLGREEAPIASHLLYTQPGILDDLIPEERQWGINAGLAWKAVAQQHVFYTDLGWSRGMLYGKQYAVDAGLIFEERKIGWK